MICEGFSSLFTCVFGWTCYVGFALFAIVGIGTMASDWWRER